VSPTLRLREVGPEQVLDCFRTIKVAVLDDLDLPLSFRSHYEEGIGPRYQQTQHAALHMAVSFWREQEIAVMLAKRYPKHGAHVARLMLTFGHGINYLDPQDETNPQHLTIWASPQALAASVVGIVPVESPEV
jgi:hypothetical protein